MLRTSFWLVVRAGVALVVPALLACSSTNPIDAPAGPDSSADSANVPVGVVPDAGADITSSPPLDEAGVDSATSDDAPSPEETGSGGDDSAVADAAPPADAAPATGKHAVLIWGYGEHWPSPPPTATPEPFDVTMKNLLEAKGLVVDLMVDKDSTVESVTGKALFIISNSVNRANLLDNGQPRFKNINVPGLVTKDGPIEVMGMGTGGAGGYSTGVGETTISIVAPATEPLTAGLTGAVRVYSATTEPCPFCVPGVCGKGGMSCCWNQTTCSTEPGDRIIYAFPGPNAKKIATVMGQPSQVTIFAYPAGATMVGGFAAPAKRMGFFIHRDADYSDDGKKLFNAAIDYLLAP